MSAKGPLSGIDICVLAGGLGTRIQSVLGDVPKILAPISRRPFLDILVHQVMSAGASRMLLLLGRYSDTVIDYIQANPYPGLEMDWSVESEPLGTAGALRLGRIKLLSDPVLLINGDTWLDLDFATLVSAHNEGVTLAAIKVDDVSRYGALAVNDDGKVTAFEEKSSAHGSGLINGGISLWSQSALYRLMNTKGPSLETDFFSKNLDLPVRAFDAGSVPFLDFGTPEAYDRAQETLPHLDRPQALAEPS